MSLRLTNSKQGLERRTSLGGLGPSLTPSFSFLDLKGCCDDTLFVPVCAVTEQNSDLMSLSTLISQRWLQLHAREICTHPPSLLTLVCLLGHSDRVVYSIEGRSTQSHVAEQMDLLFRNSTYRAQVDEAVGEDFKQQKVPVAAPEATKSRILLSDTWLDSCRRLPEKCRSQLEPRGCVCDKKRDDRLFPVA